MRRRKTKTKDEYINIRIKQLQLDLLKAQDKVDKQWYYRIIQELKWVLHHE